MFERRFYQPRFADLPGWRQGYGPGGWFLVGLAFSVLTAAIWLSLRRDRLFDAHGQPAVGHVMELDPISDEHGGGAYVTYRFWVGDDPQRYSHTGEFTGWETPARVSESMVSGAVVRRTIPVKYMPGNPWVNRPDDPTPPGSRSRWGLAIPATTAAVGWVLCAVTSVRWLKRDYTRGATTPSA